MKALETLAPGICTELQYLSYGQNGLAWGAVLRTFAIFMLFSKYPCQFSQNMFPKGNATLFWWPTKQKTAERNHPNQQEEQSKKDNGQKSRRKCSIVRETT